MRLVKGQGSIEYLALFVVTLLIIIPLFFTAFSLYTSREESTSIDQVRSSVESLSDTVDFLCIQPEGSEREVPVNVPNRVNTSATCFGWGENGDFSCENNKTIKFSIQGADIVETIDGGTKCEINGTEIPGGGNYLFHLKKHSDFVEICYKEFENGVC